MRVSTHLREVYAGLALAGNQLKATSPELSEAICRLREARQEVLEVYQLLQELEYEGSE